MSLDKHTLVEVYRHNQTTYTNSYEYNSFKRAFSEMIYGLQMDYMSNQEHSRLYIIYDRENQVSFTSSNIRHSDLFKGGTLHEVNLNNPKSPAWVFKRFFNELPVN